MSFLLMVRGFMAHFVMAFAFGASAGDRVIDGTKLDEASESLSASPPNETEFL